MAVKQKYLTPVSKALTDSDLKTLGISLIVLTKLYEKERSNSRVVSSTDNMIRQSTFVSY